MAVDRYALTDTEVADIQETQAPGQATDGAGLNGYSYSLANAEYEKKVTRQEFMLLAMLKTSTGLWPWKSDTGELKLVISAGEWMNGETVVEYAAAEVDLVENNGVNYVYATLAGSVIVNNTGFPALSATPHIPICTVTVAAGVYAYDDIDQTARMRAYLGAPGGAGPVVNVIEAVTAGVGAPNDLTADESGKTITNEGASELVYNTLPTAAAGLSFTFFVEDATWGMRITANTDDTIRVADKVSIDAGFIESAIRGSTLYLTCANATEWVATSVTGLWSLQTS